MARSFQNILLQNLDPTIQSRLRLQAVDLPSGNTFVSPGDRIRHVYFIEEGMASMTTIFLNGAQVQTDAFGREAMVCCPAILGDTPASNRIYMQIPGHGYRVSLDVARYAYREYDSFHRATLTSLYAQYRSLIQSAACNLKHSVAQRIARSLLTYRDKSGTSTLPISHDELAALLGSVRPTISVILGHFRAEGYIELYRGAIEIRDPLGLEMRACECYCILRDHPVVSFDLPPDEFIGLA